MLGICVPTYRTGRVIIKTIFDLEESLTNIDCIILIVEDGCPLKSSDYVHSNSSKIHKLVLKENQGVGRATIYGFDYLIKKGCTSLIKFDSDGQHISRLIPDIYHLSEYLQKQKFSYPFLLKGTRYEAISHGNTPLFRSLGSLLIEPLARGAINYRNLSDVANGMICLSSQSYLLLMQRKKIELEDRFLFESSLLANVGLLQFAIYEFCMDRIYHKSILSNMNEFKIIPGMLGLWIKVFLSRIFQDYIKKIGVGSFFLISSIILFNSSLFHYLLVINKLNSSGLYSSAGTASLQIFMMISFVTCISVFFILDYFRGGKTHKILTKNFLK